MKRGRLLSDDTPSGGAYGFGVENLLGDQLRKAREERGFSQEELAFRAGLHRTYIGLLERGKRSPTVDVLFRVCDALGTWPSVVLAEVEKKRVPRRGKARN